MSREARRGAWPERAGGGVMMVQTLFYAVRSCAPSVCIVFCATDDVRDGLLICDLACWCAGHKSDPCTVRRYSAAFDSLQAIKGPSFFLLFLITLFVARF